LKKALALISPIPPDRRDVSVERPSENKEAWRNGCNQTGQDNRHDSRQSAVDLQIAPIRSGKARHEDSTALKNVRCLNQALDLPNKRIRQNSPESFH
jgi:hypothetical protein